MKHVIIYEILWGWLFLPSPVRSYRAFVMMSTLKYYMFSNSRADRIIYLHQTHTFTQIILYNLHTDRS